LFVETESVWCGQGRGGKYKFKVEVVWDIAREMHKEARADSALSTLFTNEVYSTYPPSLVHNSQYELCSRGTTGCQSTSDFALLYRMLHPP